MIESSTLSFLSDLKAHNEREWFQANKERYQEAKANFERVVDDLIEAIIEFDPNLQGLEARHCVFRIFRDVRFSKNKVPYKPNMGANMARGGRKSPLAGYYIHLEPDNCFLAGGCYHPMAEQLKKIRAHIETDAASLRQITSHKSFVHYFGELEGESLKTAPNGYPKDHPEIELLRRKSFIAMHKLASDQVTDTDFVDHAAHVYQSMHPLNQFLNQALKA